MNRATNSDGITISTLSDDGKITPFKTTICWGVGEIKTEMLPVKNAPEGQQQIVLRKRAPGIIYIKNGNTIRCFLLSFIDGKLECESNREQAAVYFGESESVEKFWNSIVQETFKKC